MTDEKAKTVLDGFDKIVNQSNPNLWIDQQKELFGKLMKK